MSKQHSTEPEVRLDRLALGDVPDPSRLRTKKLSKELILDDEENPAGWDLVDEEPEKEDGSRAYNKTFERRRYVSKQMKGMAEKISSSIRRLASGKTVEDKGDFNPRFDDEDDEDENEPTKPKRRGYSLEEYEKRRKRRLYGSIGGVTALILLIIVVVAVTASGNGNAEGDEVQSVLEEGESFLEIRDQTRFGIEAGAPFVVRTSSETDRIFSVTSCNAAPIQCLGVSFLEQAPIFIGDCANDCNERVTSPVDPFEISPLISIGARVSTAGVDLAGFSVGEGVDIFVVNIGLRVNIDDADENVFFKEFDQTERFELRGFVGTLQDRNVTSLGFIVAEL